jgi:ABC-type multidrug transport system fused ATPase/permease subunit
VTLWCFVFFLSTWFLQYWSKSGRGREDIGLFIWYSLALMLAVVVLLTLKSAVFFQGSIQVSLEVNFGMLIKMTHASLERFFDRVPLGRVLNRFLKDTEVVDLQMAYSMDRLVFVAFNFMLDLCVAVYVAGPLMIPLVLIYCYLGLRLQRLNMKLVREVSRLKAVSSSPIVQTFSEGMLGCKEIRAFGIQDTMMAMFMKTLDNNMQNTILLYGARYWFSQRIQYLSLLILVPAILISVESFNVSYW